MDENKKEVVQDETMAKTPSTESVENVATKEDVEKESVFKDSDVINSDIDGGKDEEPEVSEQSEEEEEGIADPEESAEEEEQEEKATETETAIEDDAAMEDPSAFDILNMFTEQASSSELGAGVHERVKLVSVDPERRKDNNGLLIKKQLFLKFKKFSKEGVDVGEKEVSFFVIEPAKDSAINNLYTFLAQTRELLSIFLTEDEITEGFDPLSVLYDADNDDREEDVVGEDFKYDVIKKKVLKTEKSFVAVETAICSQFTKLVKDKVGFDSKSFRLKLEESTDGKYIQIPRFDRFVEKAGVSKEDSVLYTNAK